MSDPLTVVLGRHWRDRQSELAFVTRSLAGTASRLGPVRVLAPGERGSDEADGLFDVAGIGEIASPHWPADIGPDATVFVDELTPPIARMVADARPRQVWSISQGQSRDAPPQAHWKQLRLVPPLGGPADGVAGLLTIHVPVNPLALRHRHHGFGFTDYILVLAGVPEDGNQAMPALGAWLTAALSSEYVVVVQNAVASAWKGRALRGRVPVDTRMDLLRLLAHAAVCVDLCPGSSIARECVEALRLGTPIVVPAASRSAAPHAAAGGGAVFDDAGELIAAVARLRDGPDSEKAKEAGERYAEAWYGDPARTVAQLERLLREDG